MAARYAPWLADWVLLAGGLCALFCGLGVHNTSSRTLFAMGREGVLPRSLGRTPPRHGTPHVAIAVNLLLAVAVAAILIAATDQTSRDAVGANPGPLSAGYYLFAEGLTLIAPLALFCYAAVCPGLRLASISGATGTVRRAVIACAAFAAALAAGVGSLYYSFAESVPGAGIPGPYRAVPVVLAAAVLVAFAAALVLRRRRSLTGLGIVFE